MVPDIKELLTFRFRFGGGDQVARTGASRLTRRERRFGLRRGCGTWSWGRRRFPVDVVGRGRRLRRRRRGAGSTAGRSAARLLCGRAGSLLAHRQRHVLVEVAARLRDSCGRLDVACPRTIPARAPGGWSQTNAALVHHLKNTEECESLSRCRVQRISQ